MADGTQLAAVLGMSSATWGALTVGVGGALIFFTAVQASRHGVDGGTFSYMGTTTRGSRFTWACQGVGSGLVLLGSVLLVLAAAHLRVLGCILAAAAILLVLWFAMAVDLKRDADHVHKGGNGPPRTLWWCATHCLRDKPL